MRSKNFHTSFGKTVLFFATIGILAFPIPSVIASQKDNSDKAMIEESHITISDEQREQLLDAQEAYIEKSIQLDAKEAISRNKEDRILSSVKIDFQTLREHVRKSSETMGQIELLDIDALEEIESILDEEQWKWYILHNSALKSELLQTELLEDLDFDSREIEAEILSVIMIDEMFNLTPFTPLIN